MKLCNRKKVSLKMVEDLNRHFSKEDIHRHMTRCLTSLVKEMQIKTKMRFYLPPIRMARVTQMTNAGKVVEKKELLCTIHGNVNLCSHYGKQDGGSSKN